MLVNVDHPDGSTNWNHICYYILVKLDSPDGSTYSGHINIIKFWLILTLQMTAQVEVFYMYMLYIICISLCICKSTPGDLVLILIKVYPKLFSPEPLLLHSQLL